MNLFGIGASRSHEQSTSSSDSLSGSSSVSSDLSSSISRAGGSSSSWQDIAFGDLFSQLYGGAAGAAGKVAAGIPDFGEQVSSLFSGGLDTLKSLGGYADARLNGPGVVDEQIDALGSDLGDFFGTQINPALRLGAEVNGTGGAGGRLGVAQGVAAGQLGKQFVSGAAQLRAADQQQRDALALNASGLTLDSLPGLVGLAETGAGSAMLPSQLLSQVMGGPTVVGGSESSNFANADAYSIAQAIASSFGMSHDESQSSGKSKLFQFSFGGGGGGELMAFDRYKAKHGGQGPFESAYAAMFPEGILGRRGLDDERELTNQLLAKIQGDDELAGLDGLIAAAQRPLTREQHQRVRGALIDAAAEQHVVNAGYDGFKVQQAELRRRAISDSDADQLGVMDSQMAYAHSMLLSANPELKQRGAALAATALNAQQAYATRNEEQQLQLDAADATERNERRKEIQSLVDQRFVTPMTADRASYGALSAQLEDGAGGDVAPPELVSSVLDYAGAQLRAVDGGNWSFSIAGLGLQPEKLPPMTYSQLRNKLNAAHQGRQQALAAGVGDVLQGAQREGFGVNGTSVSDLLFPLADEVYKQREKESAPPSITDPNSAEDVATDLNKRTTDVLSGVGRGLFPHFVEGAARAIEGTAHAVDWAKRQLTRRPVND